VRSGRWFLLSTSILLGLALVTAGSCIARNEGEFHRPTDDDGGIDITLDSGTSDSKSELPPTDPHALLGVDPPHGPWSGGQLVIVRGNGFSSKARIWFGTDEVLAESVVPVDAERVQVLVPPGKAGAVDITAQNGDDETTKRTLIGGYEYDSFYAQPASGPTSGGTIIKLFGQSTKWDSDTEVQIDLVPCIDIVVASETELSCKTPVGTPGTKPIRVKTADGVVVDVLDAFTYGNSDNGYKGGLSGDPLSGELKVLTLDGYTGFSISDATVIVGDDAATAAVQKTDKSGVTVFTDPSLGPKRTVTISKKCYQPITFVDVPVDTVTAYIDPVLSPACIEDGDPPPTGGTPVYGGAVKGELLWQGNQEFERAGWTNVPDPKSPDEKLVAYVFELESNPKTVFQLPSEFDAVTPESSGTSGFAYVVSTSAGNLGLYALAGLENRVANPPYFKVYAMGVAKGVLTQPGQITGEVFVKVDIPLDHALTIEASGPTPNQKGPDRVGVNLALRIGELGYAVLPVGYQQKLLPTSPIGFVGIPPLVGGLGGAQYVATASAVTGPAGTTPHSITASLAFTSTAETVSLDPFVEIPALTTPSSGSWNGTNLAWGATPGGASTELTVLNIQSAGGLRNWLVAVPGPLEAAKVPDLAALSSTLGEDLALIPGALTISVTRAHIEAFDYGTLRYRQLDDRGWNAYATDVFFSHL
jgi:hypothetical protein